MLSFSLTRVWAIAEKEFFHLRRDHLTGGMVAGIPIVMSILFGYAINNDVRDLHAAVVDEANTSLSRSLVSAARASQVVDVVGSADSVMELEARLRAGTISVGIYLPPDFEQRVAHGRRPFAQLLVDDSDPIVLNAVRSLNQLPFEAISERADNAPAPGVFAPRPLFNPERRSAVFIVPGLCGVILTLTMVLLKVDRASMHFSQEVRVPLLDKDVIETAAKVDWQSCLSLADNTGKLPLRTSLSRHVRHQTASKRGFEAPMSEWLRGPLRDWAESLLDEQRLRSESFFDAKLVRQRWDEHVKGTRNWQYALWNVLMFQAWLDNQRPAATSGVV